MLLNSMLRRIPMISFNKRHHLLIPYQPFFVLCHTREPLNFNHEPQLCHQFNLSHTFQFLVYLFANIQIFFQSYTLLTPLFTISYPNHHISIKFPSNSTQKYTTHNNHIIYHPTPRSIPPPTPAPHISNRQVIQVLPVLA